jgi:hypothetical protein
MKTPTKMVNLGRPRIFLVSIPKAEYRPVMQGSFGDAVAAARRNVADLMASELANTIAHQGYKSGQGRLNAILSQMEGASRRVEYDREGLGLARGRALRAEATRLLDVLNRGH